MSNQNFFKMKHLPKEGNTLTSFLHADELLNRNEMWYLRGGDGGDGDDGDGEDPILPTGTWG